MVYLFKHDSTHDKHQYDISHKDGKLLVNENEVSVFTE